MKSKQEQGYTTSCLTFPWRGTRGREPGSIGGGKCTGGGRREGDRRDAQGGGSWEGLEINFATLRNISQ